MVSYAIITVYMTFAGIFIAVKGIINAEDAVKEDGGHFTLSDVFTNSIFRNIVISMAATYGLWTLAA
jgi:chitin synthase